MRRRRPCAIAALDRLARHVDVVVPADRHGGEPRQVADDHLRGVEQLASPAGRASRRRRRRPVSGGHDAASYTVRATSRWRTRSSTPVHGAEPPRRAPRAIATDRCRPPVQPIAIVRYVLPSAMYCGIRNCSSAVVSCRKRPRRRRSQHEARHARVCARSAAAAPSTKCGFGRKRTSNTRSASGRHAAPEAEADDVHGERRRALPVPPTTSSDARAAGRARSSGSCRRCDRPAGESAAAARRSSRDALGGRSVAAPSGCGRRVSLKRRSSAASLGLEKHELHAATGTALAAAGRRAGNRASAGPSRMSTTTAARRISPCAGERRDPRTSGSARPAGCRRRSSRGPRARESRATCRRRTGR